MERGAGWACLSLSAPAVVAVAAWLALAFLSTHRNQPIQRAQEKCRERPHAHPGIPFPSHQVTSRFRFGSGVRGLGRHSY